MKRSGTRDTYPNGDGAGIDFIGDTHGFGPLFRLDVYGQAMGQVRGEVTAAGLLALWRLIPRIIDVPPPPATVVQVELLPVQPRRSRKRVATGEAAEVAAIKERMTRGQR